jgi:hypothetical protein
MRKTLTVLAFPLCFTTIVSIFAFRPAKNPMPSPILEGAGQVQIANVSAGSSRESTRPMPKRGSTNNDVGAGTAFEIPELDSGNRKQPIRSLRAETDNDFLAAISSAKVLNGEVVSEIIRRGNPMFLDVLKNRYELRKRERLQATAAAPNLRYSENSEILLLSAMSAARGFGDPLRVYIKGPSKREVIFPEMPQLEVTIVNQHPERRTVYWTVGGDYRGGRRESFGFEVQRDDGKFMPGSPPRSGIGGGIFSCNELKFGEEWANTIAISAYVERLPPGIYMVRAAYAFGLNIGTLSDKSGTFMCFSQPIVLTVTRRKVQLAPSERAQAERWSRILPTDQPVRLVEGRYNKEIHRKFIAPKSTPGELLQLGWKAVPSLINLLDDRMLKPSQRAWAFAILFSITGDNDPLGNGQFTTASAAVDGPLGAYEVFSPAWSVLDGKGIGGAGLSRNESFLEGRINSEKQEQLTKQWLNWRKYIDVINTPELLMEKR